MIWGRLRGSQYGSVHYMYSLDSGVSKPITKRIVRKLGWFFHCSYSDSSTMSAKLQEKPASVNYVENSTGSPSFMEKVRTRFRAKEWVVDKQN